MYILKTLTLQQRSQRLLAMYRNLTGPATAPGHLFQHSMQIFDGQTSDSHKNLCTTKKAAMTSMPVHHLKKSVSVCLV